jgi:signal transduction histidine kinase
VSTQLEAVDLGAAGEVAILRLAQEGMSNAVRHAGASSIQLSLQGEAGRAVLTIKDDGHGFDPASVDGHGLGLSLMRDRVVELGGGLSVTSSPGQGTVVEAWLPVSQ